MCSDRPVVIAADALSKRYLLYPSPQARLKQFLLGGKHYEEVQALKPLTFNIYKGETVGILGRNGSGKSTLLQMLCGTLAPSTGSLSAQGRISALLELGAGFNPEFTGEENLYLNGSILGLSREQLESRYDSIVRFAAIGSFLQQPVKTYSSGMVVRLAFAIATAVDPDILIVDEALAVGDEAFQRKCFARIRELQEGGCTILFVSHSAQAVQNVCDRALLLDAGELLLDAEPKYVIAAYHRLAYASAEREALVREEIRARKGEAAGEQQQQAGHAAPDETQGKPPESRVEYTPHGGRIGDPVILDAAGQPAHTLESGKEYLYRYRVTFERDFERVRFGMMIKTISGTELAGATAGDTHAYVKSVRAGQVATVTFRFRSPFVSGTYFFNCGCVYEKDGHTAFIHRIVDACMVRVLFDAASARDGNVEINGIIQCDTQCEVAWN